MSERALNAFEKTIEEGIIIVPSIVLAEIMFIAKKRRITLSFEDTLEKIENLDNFEISGLDSVVLKVADKIDADLEMHDKLIVATSLHFESALITRDKRIRESGIVETIW